MGGDDLPDGVAAARVGDHLLDPRRKEALLVKGVQLGVDQLGVGAALLRRHNLPLHQLQFVNEDEIFTGNIIPRDIE